MAQKDFDLNEYEKKQYQELLGKLQWITSQTRPDMRFSVLGASMMASKPKVSDIINLNKIVKKLQKRSLAIKFPTMSSDTSKLKIYAFSDAALSNLPDKVSSTRGYIIFLISENKAAPLAWGSKKIKRVCKDILNAECIALSLCIDEAMVLRESLLQALNIQDEEQITPIITFTDSKSLWENIHSTNQAADYRLRREVESIRQNIQLKEIEDCVWVPARLQLADALTKGTANPQALIDILSTGIHDITW